MFEATVRIQKGRYVHTYPIALEIDENRIWFCKSPYDMKDEIKALQDAKWHGFDENPRKIWSCKNSPGNVFRLKTLMGEDTYANWDQPLIPLTVADFNRPEYEEYGVELNGAQVDMIQRGLTHHYVLLAAEMGIGKSLASIEIMERSGKKNWWYTGPASALESVEREIEKWRMDSSINLRMMSYEGLVKTMRYDFENLVVPEGIILDEISLVKNPTNHRSIAAQSICDLIREKHGFEGYVIGLSGTVSAKAPTDMWSQCETVWPGFLREGSFAAFENRYANMVSMEDAEGVTFRKRDGWKEDEVLALPERYSGLMTSYRKADWLDLPPKVYRVERAQPSKKVMRVAQSLCNIAPNTITGLTWLRALSSGFQYSMKKDGETQCEVCEGSGKYSNPEPMVCPGCNGAKVVQGYTRETVQVACPKDDLLRRELDRCEPHGRIVIAAAFQGSVDRCISICTERGWALAVVDGRGWRCYDAMGGLIRKAKPMDFWETHRGKVAFIGNPESCSYGLTLTLAHTLVFYDNNFKAEKRLQMEDRIHRMSMDKVKGACIVDFVHLPIDELVINTLKDNKRLELMSLGAVGEMIGELEDDTPESA